MLLLTVVDSPCVFRLITTPAKGLYVVIFPHGFSSTITALIRTFIDTFLALVT